MRTEPPADPHRPARRTGPLHPATLVVGVTVVVGTLVLALLAQLVNRGSNQRLLDLQVRQAATTLGASLPTLQAEMLDGLQVAQAAGPAAFREFMGRYVNSQGFASVSLWRRAGSTVTRQALVGTAPALVADGRTPFLASLGSSPKLSIAGLLPDGAGQRLGFATMPVGEHDLIVYAESALPADHHLTVPAGSAFSDLDFALYLGPTTRLSALIESSVPVPIRGLRAYSTVPFGNSSITVVGTPTTDLAGGLSAALPWIVLGLGLAFAAASMVLAEYVTRRRRQAEALAGENEQLYLEQRSIASNFQQALLPHLPRFDGLEVGARYIAGTAGLDVGGDWYDVVRTGPGTATFVVGDVCGHGLRAATTMAALRFASRAYLAEGADPVSLLEKLGRLEALDDETFATVLVGSIDAGSRSMVVASAGHPPPLVLGGPEACFVTVPAAVPVGVAATRPEAVRVTIPDGAVIVAYTDGLVERRGESLEAGLDRIRQLAWDPGWDVEEVLDRLVGTLPAHGNGDDTAMLAIRMQGDGGRP